MTNQEARNVIECILTDIVGEFADREMPKGAKHTFDALEKAKEALDKQIPKKPIEKADDYFLCYGRGGKCYYCPTCGDSLATESGDPYCNWWLDHCNKCGQKIDYSEVEDD